MSGTASNDQFFFYVARYGEIDHEEELRLLRVIGESSARLPASGRARMEGGLVSRTTSDSTINMPACVFVEGLIERFAERCDNLTAVLEYRHIDPTYRDMYYRHYSHEFFDTDRFSLRINFFGRALSRETFIVGGDDELQDWYVGSCVIGSLDGRGAICRTLLDPAYLVDRPVNVRLSRFSVNVAGRKLEVDAFPFRGQDGAMMRCAEVTLLNLMCYYSNEYSDYHMALPSEIVAHEQMYSNERVIPSRGLSYDRLSRILSDFRFFPRTYNIDSVGSRVKLGTDLPKEVLFRRLLHWYAASGIPVAINVGRPRTDDDGHSIVCVGYEDIHAPGGVGCEAVSPKLEVTPQMEEHAIRVVGRADRGRGQGRAAMWDQTRSFQLVCASDFNRDFVVIDDGLLPYALVPYSKPSSFSGFECLNYAVPLHRSMAMDALDAYENAIRAIGHPELGLMTWGNGLFGDGDTFVFDMFMTSVRGYKRDRIEYERERYHDAKRSEGNDPKKYGTGMVGDEGRPKLTVAEVHANIANVLGGLPLPHFLWVVEISRLAEYQKPREERRVFAELVLDATSGGSGDVVDKILLMRYPNRIYFRSPDGEGAVMPVGIDEVEPNPIRPYGENLSCVEPIITKAGP